MRCDNQLIVCFFQFVGQGSGEELKAPVARSFEPAIPVARQIDRGCMAITGGASFASPGVRLHAGMVRTLMLCVAIFCVGGIVGKNELRIVTTSTWKLEVSKFLENNR